MNKHEESSQPQSFLSDWSVTDAGRIITKDPVTDTTCILVGFTKVQYKLIWKSIRGFKL